MRALALFSGGLDSMLAMKLVANQGIEVIAVHLTFGVGKTYSNIPHLEKTAKMAGAKLEILDITDQYLTEILFDPKYGYGGGFNPCIDCHANMFRQASALLPKYDAKFIISGEVIGERPMSQNPDALEKVKIHADIGDIIVRPLSAKLLEPTMAETKGWIDREKLLEFSGRGRKPQIQLAKEFGFDYYEAPGGGCLLTEKHFARKMRDFIRYDKFTKEDVPIIKFGRHFRLPDGGHLVVARNEEESTIFTNTVTTKYTKVEPPQDISGPISLFSNSITQDDQTLALQIHLTYCKTDASENYTCSVLDKSVTAKPLQEKQQTAEYLI